MDPRNRWESFTPRLTPKVNIGATAILVLVVVALSGLAALDALIRPLFGG